MPPWPITTTSPAIALVSFCAPLITVAGGCAITICSIGYSGTRNRWSTGVRKRSAMPSWPAGSASTRSPGSNGNTTLEP